MPRRQLLSLLALAAAIPALAAPAAGAATIDGTPRGDHLFGTLRADAIAGHAGRDWIRARAGDDAVSGGFGRDRLAGGFGDDRVDGGPGRDTVLANKGVDAISGGAGADELWALSRKDVTGPGDTTGDTLDGGVGDDRFHTYDGEADRILCGDGRDRVIADLYDVIADATPANPNGSCERVTRSQPESDTLESDDGE
jgi:Ca2+-binding RTX toxin-like protein